MNAAFRGLVVCGALALSACANDKAARRDNSSPTSGEGDLNTAIAHRRQGNERVSEFDLNHDKRADVWSFTVPAKTEDGRDFDRLVRKELDINWDGKVDITRSYDEREQMDREALDLDFDGKVDQVNFYERSVLIRKERDLDYNSKPDLWIYFEKGRIVRKERDTNSDNKVDYWEYWEADQVDRVGEDVDGDGNVDRWTKNPNAEG
jgi:hypothetical protein